jgi:hypothetical protein
MPSIAALFAIAYIFLIVAFTIAASRFFRSLKRSAIPGLDTVEGVTDSELDAAHTVTIESAKGDPWNAINNTNQRAL